MTLVKICGLAQPEDIDAVNRYRADYAGFVFAVSRRQVTPGQAKALIAQLDDGIVPVGVFVDERVDIVAGIARHCGLGAVQLHGSETNAYISSLRRLLPPRVAIIKAVRVRDGASLETAAQYACGLLLDAYAEGVAGGGGQAFDWGLLTGFQKPYLLAGGLHEGNAAGAVALLMPLGVDVSSGVETGGAKDAEKIRRFIRSAKGGV